MALGMFAIQLSLEAATGEQYVEALHTASKAVYQVRRPRFQPKCSYIQGGPRTRQTPSPLAYFQYKRAHAKWLAIIPLAYYMQGGRLPRTC